MIVVHKFASAWGQPDLSPFVFKLETYLRLAGIAYRGQPGDPRKAPKGKLPYITDGDLSLGDTFFIIRHLKSRFGDTLDEHLSAKERAIATAVRTMLEEHLYFIILYERWQREVGFREYRGVLNRYLEQAGVPGVLRPIVLSGARRQVVQALKLQGVGRHNEEEVAEIGKGIAQSIEDFLCDGAYFFGARATSLDATVYPFLSAILDVPIPSPIKDFMNLLPKLNAYCVRMKALCWDDGVTSSGTASPASNESVLPRC